ncbi:hypothetical protein IWW39_002711 [Coemansia spiralis]|uniref:Uncharacterized protein n=1 Tax=Coemansia spiralis TaxID=417178 RepID=A0A9W8GFC4_9FUNG|nr:hypothetical protein IWW39_002711 [Coemansia spiralis]
MNGVSNGTLDENPDAWASANAMCKEFGFLPRQVAKELHVDVFMIFIYNGAALEELLRDYAACCTFPKVRSIEFMLVGPSNIEQEAFDDYSWSVIESGIRPFAQKIRQMTPRLKKVSIKIAPSDGSDFRLPVPLFNSLLAHLSKPVTEIAYELHSIPITIDQQLSGLTSLHFATMATHDSGKQIAHIQTFTDVASLFKIPAGGYVQYPRLHSFKLADVHSLDNSGQGNAGTLECLLIMPSPQTLKVLREHNIFTPTSHPKLHYVSFGMKLKSAQDAPRADVEHIRF